MPIPPVPRLTVILEPTLGGPISIASWELPTDSAVDITPGVPGVDDAIAWMVAWKPQEGAPQPMPSPGILEFGSDNVAATTVTRYLAPGYQQSTANVNRQDFRSPVAATVSNMRVRHNTPNGNGEQIVYTLHVNGVPTALTASLASTAADGSDLVNSVVIAEGDLLGVQVTKALGVGTSPTEITCSMRLDF